MTVSGFLAALVAACARRRWLVLALSLALALGSLLAARTWLGVTTDTSGMFAASLPWRQQSAALDRAFPQRQDLLVAVIDAAIPEEADVTARDLAAALRDDPAHFADATRPDASPYLARNAFLFLDRDQLTEILERTTDAQPFLGQLVADPSLRGLFGAFGLIAEGVRVGQAELGPVLPALRGFQASLAAAAAGTPEPLSWERLLAGPVANLAGRFRFVLAKPRLDYGALQPGAAASQALRDAAARLEFVREGRAHVRLTGSVALDDEEFATVAQGAAVELGGSALLVALLLFLAVRSWRLMAPILLTLALGLLLTAGFAALAVGTLNLISIAFAVLFVGIAVDFSIQFCVRLREARHEHADLAEALTATGRRAGAQILVAAAATAAGFLAFTPTAFVGVAQLGLIAGLGMLIAFACTLTFLPAALTLFRPPAEPAEIGFRFARPLDRALARAHRPVLAGFAALAVLSLALLPRVAFDGDPLHTKDPSTESMRTLADLMGDPITNPYTVELLEPTAAAARALADRLGRLPLVDSVLSLDSFVPENQDEKLPLIADAAALLTVSLAPPPSPPEVTPAGLRAATAELAAKLGEILPKLPPDHPLAAIAGDLGRLRGAPDAALLAANAALVRFLPMQLDRLRVALGATRVTEADVPPDIRRDWIAPDGRWRLQVNPKPTVQGNAGLHAFVHQVYRVAPHATGAAVTIVRSADTITSAFRFAAGGALLVIATILLLILGRVRDVLLVLAPLLLSSLLTLLLVAALPLPLNFANIIALPLLLGVGVSFNIYFVMNWRDGQDRPLGSATARAVLFSAGTTATAFGSLALSWHPGTASMGDLLLLSLGCTVFVTLAFLPALLAEMRRHVVRPVDRG